MSKGVNRLSLGPLRNPTTIRLTIVLPSTLKGSLERCAALHAQIHGAPVSVEIPIPHMLEALVQHRHPGPGKGQSAADDWEYRVGRVRCTGAMGANGSDLFTGGIGGDPAKANRVIDAEHPIGGSSRYRSHHPAY